MLRILWVDGEVLGLERGLSLHRDGSWYACSCHTGMDSWLGPWLCVRPHPRRKLPKTLMEMMAWGFCSFCKRFSLQCNTVPGILPCVPAELVHFEPKAELSSWSTIALLATRTAPPLCFKDQLLTLSREAVAVYCGIYMKPKELAVWKEWTVT